MVNKRKHFLMPSVIALTVASLSYPAMAAHVPAGVQLAEKQVLVKNNGTEVQSLDPNKVQGVPEGNIIRDLLEGLLITDEYGKEIPGVAESWENEDFKVWTFKLRKDAKWSNGDPVTAQDFVYSWRRLSDPNTASPYASYLQYAHVENIDDVIVGKKPTTALGVKALDDHTFQVTLSAPVPYFPKMLVHQSLSPVHRATVEKFGDKWTRPENWVGNGAYTLKDWVVNERIVLKRNPTYWNNAETVINEVTYLPIASEVSDVNRYRSGEIDMTLNSLPLELFSKLKKDYPQELRQGRLLCSYYYELNNQKPPLNDPRVRTALKLALDHETLVNRVINQGDEVSYSFTPPFINGLSSEVKPEWANWTQKQRETEAKRLLAEAGFDKKHPLTLNLLYNTSDAHQKIAIAATSMWKKALGADIKMENQEWKTFLDSRQNGKFDIARAGWCADYNEASSFLNTMRSNSSNNTAFYKNSAFDKLLDDALTVATDAEREKIYQEAEILLDKESAVVPIYFKSNARLVKTYVGGYSELDPFDHVYTKNLYIIKH